MEFVDYKINILSHEPYPFKYLDYYIVLYYIVLYCPASPVCCTELWTDDAHMEWPGFVRIKTKHS